MGSWRRQVVFWPIDPLPVGPQVKGRVLFGVRETNKASVPIWAREKGSGDFC